MGKTTNYDLLLFEGTDEFDYKDFNTNTKKLDAHNHDNSYLKITGGQVKGSISVTGDVTKTSDKRIKKIIEVITNPIDKLKTLTGYKYKRLDSGKIELGLLADDVLKTMPELVKVVDSDLVEDNKLKTLNYEKLTALLVEVCKEQQKSIEKLEKKIFK